MSWRRRLLWGAVPVVAILFCMDDAYIFPTALRGVTMSDLPSNRGNASKMHEMLSSAGDILDSLPRLLLLELPGCDESDRLLKQLLIPITLAWIGPMSKGSLLGGVHICRHGSRSWRADCLSEHGTLRSTSRLLVGRHLSPLRRYKGCE